MINVNKILIVQRDKKFAIAADVVSVPALNRHQTGTATTSQRFHIQPLRKPFICCTMNILLTFIILYFNNFILLRPYNLYVILARHNELPDDDILNVDICKNMLFVIIVFDMFVQSLIRL